MVREMWDIPVFLDDLAARSHVQLQDYELGVEFAVFLDNIVPGLDKHGVGQGEVGLVDDFVESVDSALVDDIAGGVGVSGEDWDRDHDYEDDHDDLFGGCFGEFLADFGLLVFELFLDVLVFEEFHGADLSRRVSGIRDFKWGR